MKSLINDIPSKVTRTFCWAGIIFPVSWIEAIMLVTGKQGITEVHNINLMIGIFTTLNGYTTPCMAGHINLNFFSGVIFDVCTLYTLIIFAYEDPTRYQLPC